MERMYMDRIIEIMARIQAIHNSAKRYHWQCNGATFEADHALFDRIAETFDSEDVDTLAEVWYMADGRPHIGDLNALASLTTSYDCQAFTEEQIYEPGANTAMFKEIKRSIDELLPLLDSTLYGNALTNIFDELNTKYKQISGLIIARLPKQPKVFARLFR